MMSTKTNSDNISTTKESKNGLSIRVVSYNVLSSELASPGYHTKCDPKHLGKSHRLRKVLDKLDKELRQEQSGKDSTDRTPTIFCLQEVSIQWVGSLHTFFTERDYVFVPALYGHKFNGYMGIATAYPMHHFETLKVDISCLGDTIKIPRPTAPSTIRYYVLNPVEKVYNTVSSTLLWWRQQNQQEDPWVYSARRFNRFIAIRLKEKKNNTTKSSTPFWIGNYHMPCAFYNPPVMNIHCDMVANKIQTLAADQEDQYVLAGDFNIKPNSPHYELLTKGNINESDETYPPPPPPLPPKWDDDKDENIKENDQTWKSTINPMRSAYAVHDKDGKEPEFTNFAQTKGMEEPFTETLDYLFLSDGWHVCDVKPLPTIENANGPYPNADEPSDHVVIAAKLELK